MATAEAPLPEASLPSAQPSADKSPTDGSSIGGRPSDKPSDRGALRSLTVNSLGIMATTVVNAGLGYGYWTLAARIMPSAEVGLGSAATSALVIISLVVHLGAGVGLIARLPQRGTAEQWRLTVVATLAATTGGTLLVAAVAELPLGLLVAPLGPLTRDPWFALWFVLGAAGWTGSGVLDYLFIAERRAGLMLVRNAATAVAKLGGLAVVAVAAPRTGAMGLLLTWSLSGLLGTGAGLVLCHRRVRPLGRVPLRAAGAELLLLARPALGHHAISVAGLVPTYLLPVAVTARLGAGANAAFFITWMIGSAIFMISPAVSSALLAEGSHLRHSAEGGGQRGGLRRIALRSLGVTVASITVPAGVLCAIGHPVLGIFGAGYRQGYGLLVVLVLSAFPDAVSNVAVATLRVRGRLNRAAALNAVIAAIAVAGTWFSTPPLGILGAGVSWLGAQLVGALAVLVFHRRLLPPKDRND
ncbi:O-antigen/teichoic acid export membrane protein [Kitasatospora sp. GP30]|uniref:lipopolysaccharide biosynthesis protein n=1 Tax=Kitasatospora sp. GP30 TaxID=3035084 RepID=UPI000C701E5C|nr:lipopolysaccharide biosynthesis protein [Kitasatospora sp. GP30]MDH6140427.1 O-antigen/teichoic acid export membrane protein [Kitasatospora sp. GP30]